LEDDTSNRMLAFSFSTASNEFTAYYSAPSVYEAYPFGTFKNEFFGKWAFMFWSLDYDVNKARMDTYINLIPYFLEIPLTYNLNIPFSGISTLGLYIDASPA
jgi:hypothetical protein